MSSDVNNVVQSSALAANVGLRHVLVCQITVINIPCFCLNWLISRQFQCRCDLSGVLAYTRSVTWPQSGLHWPVESETSLRKEGAGWGRALSVARVHLVLNPHSGRLFFFALWPLTPAAPVSCCVPGGVRYYHGCRDSHSLL